MCLPLKLTRLSKDEDRDAGYDITRGLLATKMKAKFSMIDYVRDIRLLSKWRLILGLKQDTCLQIDNQLDLEQSKLDQLKVRTSLHAYALFPRNNYLLYLL